MYGNVGGMTANYNTAVGVSSLYNTTTGTSNAAFGYSALFSNTTGAYNTAMGGLDSGTYSPMQSNTTGGFNTAVGSGAMRFNTTGYYNVALGYNALPANTTASGNTALGHQSLYSNTTASYNTAVGYQALYSNITSTSQTAVGQGALYSLSGAFSGGNTAVGQNAGYNQTSGYSNTYIGYTAGESMISGTQNTILGSFNGNSSGLDIRTASNCIVLSGGDGNPKYFFSGPGNYTLLGGISSVDTALVYSYGTYNYTSGASANMGINSSGFMYRSTSSLKYKKNVQNATHGLAELLTLRSVTYESKQESENGTVYGGLIAEEVQASGLTEFVQYAEDGTPDSLAYGNMVSLCIKAIQELKAEFDAYKATHP